ncbi:hypothetical protein J4E90_005697 [Alternaria incomplexa]|uniref:uncharacterized protein n=1 Tax=Alternaria incomplexa TaxID=1187928 RepID=UPI00221E39ED|nr:uncharacterized protein J4E90_005697 [Alternaria incomplexa]KAI4913977.1 hypothetical protein J4E90_005697 [Alternaria incomplexa]
MYISDRANEYSRQPDSASQQPRADESPGPILFYGAQDVYGQLSNMYISSFKNSIFTYGPPKYREYGCVEQFFQHTKALWAMDTECCDAIMRTSDPIKHKALGKEVKNLDVKEWNKISYKVMLKAVGLKFTVSESSDALRAVLLATSDREIVEASRDMTWGCGLTLEEAEKQKGNWPGRNLLGQALMQIRQELVDEKGRQSCGFAAPNDAVAGGQSEETRHDDALQNDMDLLRLKRRADPVYLQENDDRAEKRVKRQHSDSKATQTESTSNTEQNAEKGLAEVWWFPKPARTKRHSHGG